MNTTFAAAPPTKVRVPPEDIEEFAARELSGLGINLAHLASCTNFAALAAVAAIRGRLGGPVVTSNQAVLAATRDAIAAGARTGIPRRE